MADVFISYSKSDRSYALELAEELRTRGFSVWIDQTGIGGAKNWATEIVEAINSCSTLLCLISEHSIESNNVAKEIHLASEKQKTILPVTLEKVKLPSRLEYPLAGLQRVSYQDRAAIFSALESLHGLEATEIFPALPAHDDAIRIAVLPFDDLSPLHDNQWFADGMMDELISTLGAIEHVKVPPRSDVLHYRDNRKKSRDIAHEIGVRYLIEGGVRKSNEKIRINASLTDTSLGEQLWTNKFDGTFDDVFEFQESVAKQIATALKLKLSSEEKQKVQDHGTQNAEAYELYLKGGHEQDYHTKSKYMSALEFYESAVELDPNFGRAWIRIASVCCVYYREYSREQQWITRAERSLSKAEFISGESASSLTLRATIALVTGNLDDAILKLELANALYPKFYFAYNVLGNVFLRRGDLPRAVESFQHVIDIQESAEAYANLLSALNMEGNQERLRQAAQRSIPVFQRKLLREPENTSIAVDLAHALVWAGKVGEAERIAAPHIENEHLDGQTLSNLGDFYDLIDKPEVSILLYRKAIERGFRHIEALRTRVAPPGAKGNALEQEFNVLIRDLEQRIAAENASEASEASVI